MSKDLTKLKAEYTNLFNVIKSRAPRFPSMWMHNDLDNIEAENQAMEDRVKNNQCMYIKMNADKIARLGVLYREILSIDKNALD